jgi:NADH:ubiquinone oxidoreductase subunit C
MKVDTIKASPEAIVASAQKYFDDGCRLVAATCVEEGEELRVIYSFDRELSLENLEISTPREKAIPSLTGVYACAFLIENEMKELFGLEIDGLSLDLGGRMYLVDGAEPAPMADHNKPKAKEDEKIG